MNDQKKILKRCNKCKTTYAVDRSDDLRSYFSPSKTTLDGLNTYCKECQKKYVANRRQKIKESENYDAYRLKMVDRNKKSGYVNNQVRHMKIEDLINGIEFLKNRIVEMKIELEKRG